LILFLLILGAQCYFERLLNGRVLIGAAVIAPVAGFLLIMGADKLPMVAQRTLSFLPIPVNPVAKLVGDRSTEWRLDVWKDALPDIPAHLFVGKGYGVDPTELAFSFINADRHFMSSSEWVLTAGNFHSGPLSVIIPLGIWGVIGFVWFVVVSLKYLYRNYKKGDPSLHQVNSLLLSVFIGKLVLFLIVFGAFANEFYMFAGIVGLSVALNGAEATEPVLSESTEAEEEVAYNQRLVTE
jgi:O-antigen ligase